MGTALSLKRCQGECGIRVTSIELHHSVQATNRFFKPSSLYRFQFVCSSSNRHLTICVLEEEIEKLSHRIASATNSKHLSLALSERQASIVNIQRYTL